MAVSISGCRRRRPHGDIGVALAKGRPKRGHPSGRTKCPPHGFEPTSLQGQDAEANVPSLPPWVGPKKVKDLKFLQLDVRDFLARLLQLGHVLLFNLSARI